MAQPIGKAVAVFRTDNGDKYIDLGPVWRTKSGNISFTLEVEPVAWRDPSVPRSILINLAVQRQGQARQPGCMPDGDPSLAELDSDLPF